MKRLYKTLSNVLSGGGTKEVTVDGRPSVAHRILAWWHGSKIIVAGGPADGGGVRLRTRRAKTGTGHSLSRNANGNSDSAAAKTPTIKTAPRGGPTSSIGPARPRLYASSYEEADEDPTLDFDYPELLQELWGGAQNFPGGINRALEVMEPILRKVNRGDRLLDICAGCGGLMRHLRTFYGLNATGFDANPDLSGGSKQEVSTLNLANPGFGTETYDFVSALEGLQDMAGKRHVLKAAAQALKPGGTMLIVDVMSTASGEFLNTLQGARSRGFDAALMSPKRYAALVRECGLKAGPTQNISARYGYDVVKGWSAATQNFKGRKLSDDAKNLMQKEASRWFARVSALRGDHAKMVRLVLTKPK